MQRFLSARPHVALVIVLLIALAANRATAQAPRVGNSLTPALQAIAGPYPVREIQAFVRDSVRIVIEDSSLTVTAVMAHTWMFGPPVTAEEAGGCPPQKVLGRRIAREYWRRQGNAIAIEAVIVRVHGSARLDRLSCEDMYCGRADLDGPWIGDRPPAAQRGR